MQKKKKKNQIFDLLYLTVKLVQKWKKHLCCNLFGFLHSLTGLLASIFLTSLYLLGHMLNLQL